MSKFKVGEAVRFYCSSSEKQAASVVAGVSLERNGLYYLTYDTGTLPKTWEVDKYGLDAATKYKLVAEFCIVALPVV